MNITGVIAEYNPFHNGHAYHLNCARKETEADYIIVVMSGNFVQRGTMALLDKYVRTEMALMGGADLVLELPVLWSCASAEYFAGAGMALLDQLGCVDSLCYGCETPDADVFTAVCREICYETPLYRTLLTDFLKQGISYAKAREETVRKLLPQVNTAAVDILENPNNILALEYQKAVMKNHFNFHLYPVKRKGGEYHSHRMSDTMASASAIRKFLSEHPGLLDTQNLQPSSIEQELIQNIPSFAYHLLRQYRKEYPFLFEDDCSQMLHYCLLQNWQSGYSRYADCTSDFSNKILRHLDAYISFTQFCSILKSKDMAYVRICRILLHILLGIEQEEYDFWRGHSYLPYARILGFRRESRRLLSHLKKHSTIPLLTRAADTGKILSKEEEMLFFQKTLFADAVYRSILTGKGAVSVPNEYRRRIVII